MKTKIYQSPDGYHNDAQPICGLRQRGQYPIGER